MARDSSIKVHIVDQSEHSWETVAAYIGNDVATNEEDSKRIEKVEKTAKQWVSKKKQKATAAASQHTKRQVLVTGLQPQGSSQPPQFLLPKCLNMCFMIFQFQYCMVQ